MYEMMTRLRKSHWLLICHEILYMATILFMATNFFMPAQKENVKYVIIIVLLVALLIVEFIYAKKEMLQSKALRYGIVFYSGRLATIMLFYFWASTKYEGTIFLVLMIIFAIEAMLFISFTDFEDQFRRWACYAGYGFLYGVVSLVMLSNLLLFKKIGVTNFIKEMGIVTSVITSLIIIGELVAHIWKNFEGKLFEQNRALIDLDEANRSLQEQQEEINKVTEKLGVQKIKLQAANKKINRSHDEMSVQNEISSSIAASLEKEDLLQKITKILHIRLDLDLALVILEQDNSLLVPGEEPQGRFVAMATSMGDDYQKALLDSIMNTDLQELLLLSKTYIQNTTTDSIHFFKKLPEEMQLPSIICLPIFDKDERLGTLIVGKNKEDAFMDSRAFYENISSQLCIGISNARLYAKMNDMAVRDGLTRIYNRRHLNEILNGYIKEAMARKVPVSLALFDIDKFKMVNDTYGHQCGDEVIRHVAKLLNRGALRNNGIAGRYGGEEFVIAFLDKSLDETLGIVKDIHNQIREEVVTFGDTELQIRASVGVASYPKTCSDPSELLTRADWAMYHSKRNGRDQITIDSDQITDKM